MSNFKIFSSGLVAIALSLATDRQFMIQAAEDGLAGTKEASRLTL